MATKIAKHYKWATVVGNTITVSNTEIEWSFHIGLIENVTLTFDDGLLLVEGSQWRHTFTDLFHPFQFVEDLPPEAQPFEPHGVAHKTLWDKLCAEPKKPYVEGWDRLAEDKPYKAWFTNYKIVEVE